MSVPLPPRYLSLWLRRLATDRLRHPASAPDEDRPLVVTALVKSALRIVAMNDAAHALGLRSGMPLADARAMYPALAVAPNDPEADRRLVEAVADWCDRYTPLIGIDAPFSLPTRGRGEESQAPDGLVLDITGCAHLFGGEAALARNLLARLAAQGLHARAAIADTVGCAHAVARYGTASVVPPKEMRRALLALPVAALRLAPETVEALFTNALETGEKELLPFLALTFFGGIRPGHDGEMSKIEWGNINGSIVLRANQTKTNRKREIKVSPNLRAWLDRYAALGGDCTGKVVKLTEDQLAEKRRANWKAAGFEKIPQDIARHSFCSYLLARDGDLTAALLASGHSSPKIFWAHYYQHSTAEDTAKYWGIIPPAMAGQEKIVSITKAA